MKKLVFKLAIMLFLPLFAFNLDAQDNNSWNVFKTLPSDYSEIEGKSFSLDIPFGNSSSNLDEQSKLNLDLAANWLNNLPNLQANISGHSNRTGDESRNIDLSRKRALSVKNYLLSKGVAPDRLQHYGFGSSQPITGTNPSDAINRRVELNIIAVKQTKSIVQFKDGRQISVVYIILDNDFLRYKQSKGNQMTSIHLGEVDFIIDSYGTKRILNIQRGIVQEKEIVTEPKEQEEVLVTNKPSPEPKPKKPTKNDKPKRNTPDFLTTFKIFGGISVGQLNGGKGLLKLIYLDESPSTDFLVTERIQKGKPLGYGLNLGVEFILKDKYPIEFGFDFYSNADARSGSFFFGAGYKKEWKKITFIPNIRLHLGNKNVKMDDLINTSSYIQINSTQYYGNALTVKVRQYFSSLNTGLNIEYPIKGRISIGTRIGYNLPYRKKGKIWFWGSQSGAPIDLDSEDSDSDLTSETENISAPNVFLTLNEMEQNNKAAFLSNRGLKLDVSVKFRIFKDKY